MATKAQIKANRENAQKSTGPKTPAGKSRSSQNHLSHGFFSSCLFLSDENSEDFHDLLVELHDEFQPATPSQQILLEKMVQSQWLSLRAYRLQARALAGSLPNGVIHKDLGVLIRYHQSSDRAFLCYRTELLNDKKQRLNSEIGFEPQELPEPLETAPEPAPEPLETAPEPLETALEPHPEPPQTPPTPPETPQPQTSTPAVPPVTPLWSLEDKLDQIFNAPLPPEVMEIANKMLKRPKAA